MLGWLARRWWSRSFRRKSEAAPSEQWTVNVREVVNGLTYALTTG